MLRHVDSSNLEDTPPEQLPGAARGEASGGDVTVSTLLATMPESALVICDLGGRLPDARHGLVTGPDGYQGMAAIRDGHLFAMVPPGSGRAEFVFVDVGKGVFDYTGRNGSRLGDCAGFHVFSATGIHGTLLGTPLPDTYAIGCGHRAEVEDREFFMMALSEEDCEIGVYAYSGDFVAAGPKVTVRPRLDRDVEVVLSFPDPDAFEEIRALSEPE